MDLTNQKQSAGDNSTQIQTTNLTIVNGISEERARAICKEFFEIAKKEWTCEAVVIASQRVEVLEDKVMPKLIEHDNSLKMFASPDFQFTLRKAQITAASSNRDADYDILSELLVDRVKNDNNLERISGISKAIEIANKVSDSALTGLTVCYLIQQFMMPQSDDLRDCLSQLEKLYSNVIGVNELPSNDAWLDHLDILSVIRLGISGINSFKKSSEIIPSLLHKFIISGINADSADYLALKEKFISNSLPLNLFVPHPLKENYYIPKVFCDADNARIDYLFGGRTTPISVHLSDVQKEVFEEARNLMLQAEPNNVEMKNRILSIWDEYPTLQKVRLWWDNLHIHFNITQVGISLANAYAHTKDNRIPKEL